MYSLGVMETFPFFAENVSKKTIVVIVSISLYFFPIDFPQGLAKRFTFVRVHVVVS